MRSATNSMGKRPQCHSREKSGCCTYSILVRHAQTIIIICFHGHYHNRPAYSGSKYNLESIASTNISGLHMKILNGLTYHPPLKNKLESYLLILITLPRFSARPIRQFNKGQKSAGMGYFQTMPLPQNHKLFHNLQQIFHSISKNEIRKQHKKIVPRTLVQLSLMKKPKPERWAPSR